MITYVCKYTPVELFAAFGLPAQPFAETADAFDRSDAVAHANLCGFGKALLQAALAGRVPALVLVNCCDVMRRAYDVLRQAGCCELLFLLDLPHEDSECQRARYAWELKRLWDALAAYSGRSFERQAFFSAFSTPEAPQSPYIALLGARCPPSLVTLAQESCSPLPVRDLTCVGSRCVALPQGETDEALLTAYAACLLGQLPCRRMADSSGRRALLNDPHLAGIVYHTQRFCDYYAPEYAALRRQSSLPMTRVETDYTAQSAGQLRTRLQAFDEALPQAEGRENVPQTGAYFAGVDSGSTSTDAVIVDRAGKLIASAILPTGGSIRASAEEALGQALQQAGLQREQLARCVATGYGRAGLAADGSVTEITCHARGARQLYPQVRTIIDIGGQDSKAIRLDGQGKVASFAMNDKCAAGTGRFLEAMARTLGLPMEEMSTVGLHWREDVTVSSMCTVFAESEVVSLVAEQKAIPDIVHGLNRSVAVRVCALAARTGGEAPYMITGGVAQNRGVVAAVEERLGAPLYVCSEAQLCGAYGAALIAAGL